MEKTALITGISGQDGAYLAALLLKKGYRVVGLVRSQGSTALWGLDYLQIKSSVLIEECDLLDISQIIKLLFQYKPVEIYNLAAQSSVSMSFKQPIGTFRFNTMSVYNLLEAIKLVDDRIKFYQASSSEMYGRVLNLPINENSVLHPVSPYAISKAAAHWSCIHYRESYGIYVCCGILFNHESYLRSSNFFMKKIIRESIEMSLGQRDVLLVGNIDISRDFGYAPRYVDGMYAMMHAEKASDYILCSGKSVRLKDIISYLFEQLKLDAGRCQVSQELYRPTDIDDIYGDPSRAMKELGWKYSMDYKDLINVLLEEELMNVTRTGKLTVN